MSDIKAYKFIVKGRVQGVGFRYFVLTEAKNLDIAGTVRNLPDGTVEIFAQSDVQSIYQLKSRLKKGPSFARVDDIIETEDVVNDQIKQFKVTY